MIKNIIFDFDGVICESVHIKTEAFYEMYLPYGVEIAKKVKAHHLKNGGMSRFDKFKYYETKLLGKEITQTRMQELSTQFSALVKKKVIHAPFVPGALAFLQNNSQLYNCFIVSATPMEEMIEIAESKAIADCFKMICGSPTGKVEWGEYLIKEYRLNPEETLFIGDAKNDYIAAQANRFHFLWRKTDIPADIPESVPHVSDLTSLHTLLTDINYFR